MDKWGQNTLSSFVRQCCDDLNNTTVIRIKNGWKVSRELVPIQLPGCTHPTDKSLELLYSKARETLKDMDLTYYLQVQLIGADLETRSIESENHKPSPTLCGIQSTVGLPQNTGDDL